MSKTRTIFSCILIIFMFTLILGGVGGCSRNVDTGGDYINLAGLSSTVADPIIYDMMENPSNYVGKTVKISGTYGRLVHSGTKKTCNVAIINSSCCPNGLEFSLKDNNYPREGSRIIVEGTFGTYTQNGYKCCYLRQAKLL